MKRTPLLFLLILFSPVSAMAAEGKVIASIKPLHSLVAAVMEGDENAPLLLVDGKSSPHSFVLRPSQAQAIAKADIVFYMGDTFESFLDKTLDTAPPGVRKVPMEKVLGITRYPARVGNGWEPHEEEGEKGHHHEGKYDLHLWMAPANAKAMVGEIIKQLSELYPAHAALYRDNGRKLQTRIDAMDREMDMRTVGLRNKPFIVFHDAYQYFEKSFQLKDVGAITLSPDRAAGAKHISEIRKRIKDTGALCVFREPQFDAKAVDSLLEGTTAKSAVLDPEAALLTPGPELYFQMMDAIVQGLEDCLK